VEWLIVDESDKLFEEGKTGFRDQVHTGYIDWFGTMTNLSDGPLGTTNVTSLA
jgi:hypothetical protein